MRTIQFLRACIIFLIPFLLIYGSLHAQCTATSYSTATTLSSDNSIGGIAFINPGNAAISDNSFATAPAVASLFSSNTEYLKATGFSFNIPTNSIICGIQVEVERFATNIVALLTSVEDNSIRLVKNDVVTGANRANGSAWGTSEQTILYGGSSDTWTSTWTPADINSANFGVAFSATINGLVSVLPSVRVDRIRIRVYYDVLLPLHFSGLHAQQVDNIAVITCNIPNPDQLEQIELQRSGDQVNWKTIKQLKQFASHASALTWRDSSVYPGIYYYRVKAINAASAALFSGIRKLEMISSTNDILVNNPVNDLLNINCHGMRTLSIYDLMGNRIMQRSFKSPAHTATVSLASLRPGIYVLQIDNKRKLIIKN